MNAEKQKIINSVVGLYNTNFMQENCTDKEWLEYLKKNHHKMGALERLKYLTGDRNEPFKDMG